MVSAGTDKRRAALTVNRQRAKDMRHAPASAEKLLWSEVRNRKLAGFKFRRQVPIGRYIADFGCVERKLIVELDGPLHSGRAAYDANRDATLHALGYRVLRISNDELGGNFAGVLATILHILRGGAPSP